VELHGGKIAVHSAGDNQGCEFTITLPRDGIVEPHNEVPLTDASAPRGTARRILIADDNRDGAESLGLLLQMECHEVHLAHDGAAALEMARRLKPEFALLDIGMPGLTGYEVAARIRAEDWGRQMTLIAVTGWGQESDRQKARLAGFDHHLTKPIDLTELVRLFAGTRGQFHAVETLNETN
jgi:CheY-like chemotaxis protein